jgi:hypothetical protein
MTWSDYDTWKLTPPDDPDEREDGDELTEDDEPRVPEDDCLHNGEVMYG